MEIRGRIIGNNCEGVFHRLIREGVDAKLAKNSIIFKPSITAGLIEPGPEYYQIPEAVKGVSNVFYIIDTCEHGGYRGNIGVATVVCDLKGKRFLPYYLPIKPKKGKTAFFGNVSSIATVTAYHSDGTFVVMSHKIRKNSRGFLYIETAKIYLGTSLSAEQKHFTDAVMAAQEKAACINCTCVHFAKRNMKKKRR